jgi:hypothetical protein
MANIIPTSRGTITQKLAIQEKEYPCIVDINCPSLRRRDAQLEGAGCQCEILGTNGMDQTTVSPIRYIPEIVIRQVKSYKLLMINTIHPRKSIPTWYCYINKGVINCSKPEVPIMYQKTLFKIRSRILKICHCVINEKYSGICNKTYFCG